MCGVVPGTMSAFALRNTQVISRRYLRGSCTVPPISGWPRGGVSSPTPPSTPLDRLLHRYVGVTIDGDSYWFRPTKQRRTTTTRGRHTQMSTDPGVVGAPTSNARVSGERPHLVRDEGRTPGKLNPIGVAHPFNPSNGTRTRYDVAPGPPTSIAINSSPSPTSQRSPSPVQPASPQANS